MRAFGSPPDLTALRGSYLVSLKTDLGALEGLQSEVDFGFAEQRTYEDLRRLAHVQAGNAATFGFEALGLAARAVDILLSERQGPSDELAPLIGTWQRKLQKACQGG